MNLDFDIQDDVLIKYYGSESEIVIPEGVREIGRNAFSNQRNIIKVTLPSTLQHIGAKAFYKCKNLESIIIPEAVETIEHCAFKECNKLKTITIPSGVKKISWEAFASCTRLKEVKLSEGLKVIGGYAFEYCKKIKELSIPTTVEKIGTCAFYNCEALKKINVSSDIMKIEVDAFKGCSRLIDNNDMIIIGGILCNYEGSGGKVIIPEGVIEIVTSVFRSSSITEVVLPSTLKRINYDTYWGLDVFLECYELLDFIVDPANEVYSAQDGMLVNKARDTIVWFPAGKKVSEYVIPDNITTIARKAFIDCRNLKKIFIPASVKVIEDEVFPRYDGDIKFMFEEIEVDPKAGSIAIGRKVFDFGREEYPLVYPKLPITFIKDEEAQVRLGLGFCYNSGLYDGEYLDIYKEYVKSHIAILKERADSLCLFDVLSYCSTILKSNTSEEIIKYNELSDTTKGLLLEKAVLSNEIELVKKVFEECKTIKYTAKALGLACLYSDLEIVKVLVEAGATFKYKNKNDKDIPTYYGVYFSKYRYFPANYSLLIAKTNINIMNLEGRYSTYQKHFSGINFTSDLLSQKKENSQKLRGDIVEYLLIQSKVEFDSRGALFYSLLWGCSEVAQRLIQKGVELNIDDIEMLSSICNTYSREEIILSLSALSASNALYALKLFNKYLKKHEKKMIFNQKIYESDKTSFLEADVLSFLFAETDTSRIVKYRLLCKIIDREDVKALDVLANAGALKTKVQREKVISYASEHKKHEALAWLLDYKRRNVDIAAEEAKEEVKMLKELSEDPNSVSALKKKWSYKKLDNGTLKIISYKGSQLEVEVPATIGKLAVTVIGEKAFIALDKVKNKNENRKYIKKVIIPEGVVEIGEEAFKGCKSLETIVLPSSIKIIDERAFHNCESLININLPDNVVLIGRYAFDGCKSLKTIVLPASVMIIGECAFKNCSELTNINIPKYTIIDRKAFSGCNKLTNEDGMVIIDDILYNYSIPKMKIAIAVIPEGVKKIAAYSFENIKITEVHIPKTVTTIGSCAFNNCPKLRHVYISSSVIEFGEYVFGYPDDFHHVGDRIHDIYVHTPEGSAAESYIKRYRNVHVVNDYPQE